jgi:hypothetical protein
MFFGRIASIFGLVIFLVIGFGCLSFFGLVGGGRLTTTTSEINMVQPNGFTQRDYSYSQTNLNNSEANKNNAEAHSIWVVGDGQAEKLHAEACQIHPYQEGCMPPQEKASPLTWFSFGVLTVGAALAGIFTLAMKKS